MSLPISRLFVHGFPSLYGGASTELHHQILAWRKMGLEVHLIPTWPATNEPLLPEINSLGVIVHNANDFACLQAGYPILGFCNADFLTSLPMIRQYTRRTVFIKCMTWIFEKEKAAMQQGQIAMFLYQNESVMIKHMPELKTLNEESSIQFASFKPYFDTSRFPFIENRSSEFIGCGRISRQDADKSAFEFSVEDGHNRQGPRSSLYWNPAIVHDLLQQRKRIEYPRPLRKAT